MTTFPSIYKAKAVQVTPTAVTAFIPQVFGDVSVEINEFLGGTPSAPGLGWVFFQAGNSDFPVWSEVGVTAIDGDFGDLLVEGGSVNLVNGAVTTIKLADGAVTTPKIAASAVTNAKLANIPLNYFKGGGASNLPVDLSPYQARVALASDAGSSGYFLRSDGQWQNLIPTLGLSSTTVITLAGEGHALTLGTPGGMNVAGYHQGFQARNAGANTTLYLNPFGGTVNVGGADAAQFPTGLQIGDSAHATSRRATISLGSGWQFLQDFSGAGTKDFTIYQMTNGRSPFKISADGTIVTLPASTRLVSQTTGPQINSNGNYIVLQAIDNLYYDIGGSGTNYWRRTSDYAQLMYLDANGALTTANTITAGSNITSAGEIYAGSACWFRVRGTGTGVYWETWAGGWYMQDGSWMRVYNNKGIYTTAEIRGGTLSATSAGGINMEGASGAVLRIYSAVDSNHYLGYWGGTAYEVNPASGIGSNGPRLVGYSSVVLTTQVNGRNWLFEYGGSAYGVAAWNVFSSRKIKRDIVSLDPDECLDMVRRWKPVEYSPLDDDVRRDGFVAEDMHEVTPNVVTVAHTDDNPDFPAGSPNAIGYGECSVRLAGAVQALLARIEALEAA